MIDDKFRISGRDQASLGQPGVTTVFPRQGHYAMDPVILAEFPPAHVTIEQIGDLPRHDLAALAGR
jgi:hypothetical protein